MQLETIQPESKFPNEYSGVIFILIDQRLKKLLKKYKGVPILWIEQGLTSHGVWTSGQPI